MRGLLIGGSSHCGKSTLAHRLGTALGWRVRSTDGLGRHPGRPWTGVPDAVEEFYYALSDDTIYWFLRVHHTNFWPLLERIIEEEAAADGGFIMEGSALRPEVVATLNDTGLLAVCLYAKAEFLEERMKRESGYHDRDARQKRFIDKFIARSLRDNRELREAAQAHGIRLIDVTDPIGLERATEHLLEDLQH